jgi:hypothetical protein
MILSFLQLPDQLVPLVNAGLVGAVGWLIKSNIDLKVNVAVLTQKLDDVLKHCKRCNP